MSSSSSQTVQKPGELNPRALKKLSGSSIFCFFPDIKMGDVSKRILILGEDHHNKGCCKKGYDIHQWLYDLSEKSPECLDIFVEDEFDFNAAENKGQYSLYQYTNPLQAIKNKFSDCKDKTFKKSNKKCPDKLRYHYIDIRRIKGMSYPVREIYQSWYSIISTKQLKTDEKYYNNREKLFNYMLGLNRSEEARHYFIEYLATIKLEIYKSTVNSAFNNDDTFKNQFFEEYNDDYMDRYLPKLDKEIKKLPFDSEGKTRFLTVLRDVYLSVPLGTKMFKTFSPLFMCLLLIPQDVYFLLRLFMMFDNNEKKKSRGPPGCSDNPTVKNAIFHGGAFHSRIYIEFIKKFFEKEPLVYLDDKELENKCIEFESDFDFFSSDFTKFTEQSSDERPNSSNALEEQIDYLDRLTDFVKFVKPLKPKPN